MAGRIKGITVEIGGDTTGLEKALKNVNSTIKNTQSQLKDVNRLLKLDPSNTELLSQKQRALKDAIGATKEKLDSLKIAQEQAKQQLENGDLGQDKYDALQREIIETEDNLGGQLTILKSQIQELAISFGEMLMPAIRAIVSKVQAFVDKLNNMSESQRKAVLTIGLIIAALGPLLVILGTVISKVGVAMQGFVKLATGVKKLGVAVKAGTGIFGKLGAALGGISAPILAVIAVIAVPGQNTTSWSARS